MLATLLAMSGYSVVTAEHGATGLSMAREARPCLILLDLMMPVMDGIEFRERQARDAAIAAIPVVIVSAHAGAERLAAELGAVNCVQKPISYEQLIEAVDAACRKTPPPA